MVREFLGNIKGQKGDPGEKGEPGERGQDSDVTQELLTTELENLSDGVVSQREEYSTNASDFGAIGDGVTDDTLALQSAIDHANTKSRVLYIPKGRYLISAPLFLNGCSVYAPKGNVYEKTNYQGVVIVCATQDFIAIKQGSLKMPDIQFTLSDIMVENALVGFEINYVINSVFTNLYVRLSDTGFKMGDTTAVGSMFNHFNNFYTVDCRIGIESHSKGYFNNNTFNNGFIAGDEYAIKINVDGGYGAVNNTFNNVEIKSTLGRGIILESSSNTNFNNCYFEVGGNAIRTLNFCALNLVDCVYGVFKAENTNGDTSVVFAEGGLHMKVDGGVIFLNEGNTNGLFYDATIVETHQNIYQFKDIRRSQTSSAPGFKMYEHEINSNVYAPQIKDFVKKQELDGFVNLHFEPIELLKTTSHDITEYDIIETSETITGKDINLKPGYWSVDVSVMFESETSNTNYLYLRKGNANILASINTNSVHTINTVIKVSPGESVSLRLYSNNDFTVLGHMKNYATFKYVGQL